MTPSVVIDMGRQALFTVLMVIAPILGIGLLAGLTVAILQATTQIQEQTLAFVPKIFAVLGSIAVFGPWMMTTVVDFVTNLFESIPEIVG